MLREEAGYPAQSASTYLRRVVKCSLLLACTSPLLYGAIVHALRLVGVDHDKVCGGREMRGEVATTDRRLWSPVQCFWLPVQCLPGGKFSVQALCSGCKLGCTGINPFFLLWWAYRTCRSVGYRYRSHTEPHRSVSYIPSLIPEKSVGDIYRPNTPLPPDILLVYTYPYIPNTPLLFH